MDNLGQKIKELRISNDLTQPQLAKVLNVSNGIISTWENNLYEPKASYLKKIACYFKVSIDYLLDIEDDFGVKDNITEPLTYDEKKILDIYKALPEDRKKRLMVNALDQFELYKGQNYENYFKIKKA